MDRKTGISLLAFICLIIHFQPLALSGPTYWNIYPNWRMKQSNGGSISFNSEARFDNFSFSNGYAYFKNFRFPLGYVWENIGFKCNPSSATMTVVSIPNRNRITYTVSAPDWVTSVTRIITNHTYAPYRVDGADDFIFNNGVLFVEIKHRSPATVVAYWSSSPPTVSGLLDGWESDFIGSLIAEYTNVIGPVFWVFVTLIFMVPLVNRIGVFPVVIIAGMWWATFLFILPAYALNMGMAIVVLSGMSVLVILFFTRRRQYV